MAYSEGQNNWTPAMVETAVSMAKDEKSAAEIARKVGKTRSAVCGRLFRMGIKLKGRSGGASQKRNIERRAKPAPVPRAVPQVRRFEPPVPREVEPLIPFELPVVARGGKPPANTAAAVLELQKHECKYPIGDPGSPGFSFCRAPVGGCDTTYCAAHHAICWVP
ncbi:MAG: GcrA family cell cycle regulator, partial [Parvibaculum sp.]|nr:GcrA family cell cycle regulator [Parvibaculum sp.]